MGDATPDSKSLPESRHLTFTAIFVLAIAGITVASLPVYANIDSQLRFEALDDLLRDGTVADTKYSLIGPIFAAPLWWLAPAGKEFEICWQFNKGVVVLASVGLWWVLAPVLTIDQRYRFVLLVVMASMVPYQTMYFGGEPFTVACVGVGTAAAIVRRSWWGWPLAAVGAANLPASALGFAIAAAVTCWHRRQWRHALAVVGMVGLVLIENWLRRGSPFSGGYENDHGHPSILSHSGRPGFSYPLILGLLSILFSFGRGLVFFCPGLFVPLDRRAAEDSDREGDLRLLWHVWIGFVAGLVLVYAKWWSWYGGVFWGPRFFLFAALPAALVLAVRSAPPFNRRPIVNGVVLGVLLLSFWVGASGAVFRDAGDVKFLENDYALEFVIWYVPDFSPLVKPLLAWPTMAALDAGRLLVFAFTAGYLAAPLAATVARQSLAALRSLRADFRERRFRF